MSYSEDYSIVDTSVDDVNLLSTKRDLALLQSGRSSIQFEPAVVLDIVLDDAHPMFRRGLGNIVSPEEHPPNFSGVTPSSNDPDYFSIGTALIRLCYTHAKFEKESLIWAVPLDSSLVSVPVLNEIVHVVKIFDKYYYTNRVNTKNSCNTSADFRYEQSYGKKDSNRSYQAETLSGPISRFDSFSGPSPSGFNGILGDYFWFNKNIRNLRRFEGDTIVEGRFGNSIRFGSYDDNRLNDSGYYDNYKSGDSSFGGGNPMVLIRNRQRPIAKDSKQQLHPLLNPILPISSSKNEVNVSGYILEDINNDGSSIHMTSGKTVSSFKTTCYKRCFSSSKTEEQPNFSPSGSTNFVFPTLNKDQIVINSDRLIMSSRFGESLYFSKKRHSFVTDGEFTVDSHDQVVVTTNTKVVINSPAIYLGQYDSTAEPVLLGQTSVNWLYDLCEWLLHHTHYYKHSHSGGSGAASTGVNSGGSGAASKGVNSGGSGAASPGVNSGGSGAASPGVTQLPVEIQRLIMLRDNLHTIMSRRVFVTGGGLSTGSNGGSIKDGVSPVIINTFSGEGVPGGWRGKNRT